MLLHKYKDDSSIFYTLLDAEERVVVKATDYLRILRRNKRPVESQRQIAYVLKKYCDWLEEHFEGVSVDEILKVATGDDIVEWINEQRGAGISESTIHNREVLIREFYRWLTTSEGGSITENIPWGDKTFSKNQHNKLPRFVTMEQVITLLQGLYNESQRVAVHFLFDTGLRVSELTRLTNNLLPDERDWPEEVNYFPLEVLGSKSYDGSKYKYRYTIISRPVLARVRRYHSSQQYNLSNWNIYDPYKPTFLTVHGNKLTVDSVQKCITAAWRRQGRNNKEISPHRLRHGTAYSVLQSEFGKELIDNLLVLKSMFGHERISTTEIYTSIPITALRSLGGKQQIRLKYEEAQQIYDATYLPARMHKERRGHSK
ncbi:MAG: tyrosine-type recombinase/integrase [Acidobacteriota bacterium]|nr:tyrosine-type recombinase/integrase [Acidobacteriota bacterium]